MDDAALPVCDAMWPHCRCAPKRSQQADRARHRARRTRRVSRRGSKLAISEHVHCDRTGSAAGYSTRLKARYMQSMRPRALLGWRVACGGHRTVTEMISYANGGWKERKITKAHSSTPVFGREAERIAAPSPLAATTPMLLEQRLQKRRPPPAHSPCPQLPDC